MGTMRSLLVAVVLFAGCAVRGEVLLRYAMDDLACQPDDISTRAVSHTHYEAEGCGKRLLYECRTRDECERVSEVHVVSMRGAR